MRKRTPIFLLAIVILLCLGLIFFEAQAKILRRVIDDIVYDNRNHYLPCEKLPTETEVRKVVDFHVDVARVDLLDLTDDVGVEIDAAACPGKADLLIWYASHQNRLAIEEIIAGETFFGIPYRLQNR